MTVLDRTELVQTELVQCLAKDESCSSVSDLDTNMFLCTLTIFKVQLYFGIDPFNIIRNNYSVCFS